MVVGSILSSIFTVSASAEPASVDGIDIPTQSSGDGLTAPFSAIVKTRLAQVRVRPENDSPEVGLLREGAMVTVTACQPDCGAPHAWALLGADGAVKMEVLDRQPVRVEASAEPTPESLWYGRVGKLGIKIFKEPRLHGPILTRKRLSREMAFLPKVPLRQSGWFERVEGGFVRARLRRDSYAQSLPRRGAPTSAVRFRHSQRQHGGKRPARKAAPLRSGRRAGDRQCAYRHRSRSLAEERPPRRDAAQSTPIDSRRRQMGPG